MAGCLSLSLPSALHLSPFSLSPSGLGCAVQIVVLSEGQVLESGAHQDLIAKDGAYARMWEMQAQNQGENAEVLPE
jgi:hypothetical protein